MAWNRGGSRREETRAVKVALKALGINAVVGHGRGTAWGWLTINVGEGQQFGEHDKVDPDHYTCRPGCPRCEKMQRLVDLTLRTAQEVTGRHGEYQGKINVYTQDEWIEKRGESIPIEHDLSLLDGNLKSEPGKGIKYHESNRSDNTADRA